MHTSLQNRVLYRFILKEWMVFIPVKFNLTDFVEEFFHTATWDRTRLIPLMTIKNTVLVCSCKKNAQ